MKRKYAEYLLKKTKEDYNKIAEEFSRTREKPWPEIKFLIDNYVIAGERILDLGCGNGRLLEFFKDKRVDYVGTDFSEKLIKIAQKRYLPQSRTFLPLAIRFYLADALNLPFPPVYFDKIYTIATLHQIPSQELRLEFLKEVKRVLRQDGLFILTVWKFKSKKELFLIIKYTILKVFCKSKLDYRDIFEPWGKKIKRYYHCFSKKELMALVKKAGFKIEECGIVRNERGIRKNIYLVAKK